MEHTYENVAALAGRAAGALASYLGPFVTSLINQQHAAKNNARTGIRPLGREASCGVG